MELKLFQTAKHEINYTVRKQTPSRFKLSQQFCYDSQHCVTRTFMQAMIESTIYQRFGDYLFLRQGQPPTLETLVPRLLQLYQCAFCHPGRTLYISLYPVCTFLVARRSEQECLANFLTLHRTSRPATNYAVCKNVIKKTT